MDELDAYRRGSERLLELIAGGPSSSTTMASRRQRAVERLAQSRKLLAMFGDPQEAFPIVHVTGTSGKGSTATIMAAILTAAGYRVGLRTSPYLQVATEKLQLRDRLIDAWSFDRLSAEVVEAHGQLRAAGEGDPRLGYADAWIVMTLLWFAEQQVDIGIVEVGAGGRFDSTNVFDAAASVITTVGLDHLDALGPGLADIAWHKAGIIKPGATVVVGDVPPSAWDVIEREAWSKGAVITRPTSDREFGAGAAMPGAFQQMNAALAVATIRALGERGFAVSDAAISEGISRGSLPGRLERMPGARATHVWIDGAHNADKVAALARDVQTIANGGPPPVIVLGMLGAKDASAIVAGLAPIASAIVATQPSVVGRTALATRNLAALVASGGYAGAVYAEPDPLAALRRAEAVAESLGAHVLATGSLYLAGQVRRRWYPDREIIVQRTPWPVLSGGKV